MKVNFIRKPSSAKELYPQDDFIIEKAVEIDKDLFMMFLRDIQKEYNFIKENNELMYCDEQNIMHCIFATTKESDFGILIESEGYNYARYFAYLPKILVTIIKEN